MKRKKEYVEQLNEIVPAIVRMADNVIAYELANNLSPLSQQRWIIEQLREVGMGITNVHGWLLKQDVVWCRYEYMLPVQMQLIHSDNLHP